VPPVRLDHPVPQAYRGVPVIRVNVVKKVNVVNHHTRAHHPTPPVFNVQVDHRACRVDPELQVSLVSPDKWVAPDSRLGVDSRVPPARRVKEVNRAAQGNREVLAQPDKMASAKSPDLDPEVRQAPPDHLEARVRLVLRDSMGKRDNPVSLGNRAIRDIRVKMVNRALRAITDLRVVMPNTANALSVLLQLLIRS